LENYKIDEKFTVVLCILLISFFFGTPLNCRHVAS